ncbi:MAG: hypothetical protein ABMA00_20665, partial [Gemmatimonas sp.]
MAIFECGLVDIGGNAIEQDEHGPARRHGGSGDGHPTGENHRKVKDEVEHGALAQVAQNANRARVA